MTLVSFANKFTIKGYLSLVSDYHISMKVKLEQVISWFKDGTPVLSTKFEISTIFGSAKISNLVGDEAVIFYTHILLDCWLTFSWFKRCRRFSERSKSSFNNNIQPLGKLSHSDLDQRALDALKEFPPDGALGVLTQFLESNLAHVSNKSAFLCGVMKTYR